MVGRPEKGRLVARKLTDYTLGLYYFNEHARELAATPSSNRWNADGTGYTINSESVIPPVTSGNQGWDYPGSWFVQRASQARARSYAAYGQVTSHEGEV